LLVTTPRLREALKISSPVAKSTTEKAQAA